MPTWNSLLRRAVLRLLKFPKRIYMAAQPPRTTTLPVSLYVTLFAVSGLLLFFSNKYCCDLLLLYICTRPTHLHSVQYGWGVKLYSLSLCSVWAPCTLRTHVDSRAACAPSSAGAQSLSRCGNIHVHSCGAGWHAVRDGTHGRVSW